jgi:hypothetical protein
MTGAEIVTAIDTELGSSAWQSGGSGSTDLTYTASTRLLESSSGTDVTLPLADGTNAGLMASADFTKLAGIEAGAERVTPAIISVNSSRALLLTDVRDILEVNTSGGAVVITIPTNASVAFPIGTIINVTLVDETNTATITAATGVTLNGVTAGSGDMVSDPYAGISLYKRATDAWVVQGKIGAIS